MALSLQDIAREHGPVVMHLGQRLPLAELEELVLRLFRKVHVEITPHGDIVFMSPTRRQVHTVVMDLQAFMQEWNKAMGKPGEVTGEDLGYVQSNSAVMCPDAAWVSRAQIMALPEADRNRWAMPVVPEFIAEVVSYSDTLADQQARMEVYMASGTQLGWLIDPTHEHAYIYRPGQPVEHIPSFDATLSGDPVMQGLLVPLAELRIRP